MPVRPIINSPAATGDRPPLSLSVSLSLSLSFSALASLGSASIIAGRAHAPLRFAAKTSPT